MAFVIDPNEFDCSRKRLSIKLYEIDPRVFWNVGYVDHILEDVIDMHGI